MKKTITLISFLTCMYTAGAVYAGNLWQPVAARPAAGQEQIRATRSLTFYAADAMLQTALAAAAKGTGGRTIELPMPDGTYRSFRVQPTTLLPEALAARYPELQTYNAVATDDASVTAKIDHTVYGFHAMIFDGERTSFVDPAGNKADGYYVVHYKRDEVRGIDEGAGCQTLNTSHTQHAGAQAKNTDAQAMVLNGYTLRKYRLALSCTHQYAQKVTASATPTKAQVLSKMTTTMNRVNGVYERELSVTMVFVSNEDALIFTADAGDPLGASNSSASSLLSLNQTLCDGVIGSANYDIGHAFSTGAGGLSQVGVVCKNTFKAQSVTGSETPYGDGFDIDYVVHEMGHEFGADHTFNNNQSGACNANAMPLTAYEPGSGSTLMAYAGICVPDNLQAHSDAFFHAASLIQLRTFINGDGDVCAEKIATNNKPAGVPAFTATYSIPARTPFELTAPVATDSMNGATITYSWEQWNLGEFGQTQVNTKTSGPIFRAYAPVASATRIFPNLEMVRNGVVSNASIDKSSGEKLPDTSRSLTFKLAVRSLSNNYGCFTLPDDSIRLNVVKTTGTTGFRVKSQSVSGIVLQGNSTETITWDVAGSNAAPVNAANVDIYLSADRGNTWTYHLGTFPNTGSAEVVVPNPDTNIVAARIKVKGAGNVFFNMNSRDVAVARNFESTVKIYPVPATSMLHIVSEKNGVVAAVIFDIAGRMVWQGEINAQLDLPVATWPAGVYIMKLTDASGRKSVRRFMVQ